MYGLKKDNIFLIFLLKLYHFFLIRFFDNTVKLKEGDIAVFDGLTYHRTTPVNLFKDIEDKRITLYFLFTNLDTIKDALTLHDKKFMTNTKEKLAKNIEIKKINDVSISILNKEYSRTVEKILGD